MMEVMEGLCEAYWAFCDNMSESVRIAQCIKYWASRSNIHRVRADSGALLWALVA